MTKVFKNITIAFVLALASLFAGLFFAGCGIDYSIINLKADTEVIELDVGDSVDVTVKVEGFQKGFSTLSDIQCSKPSIAKIENINYNNDEIKFTIVAKAGGTANVTVTTYEAKKSCQISLSVRQVSSTMVASGKLMYLSESAPFEPDGGYFEFDNNTTQKEITTFYFDNTNPVVDFDASKLNEVELSLTEEYIAYFKNGIGTITQKKLSIFDRAEIDFDGTIKLSYQGQETKRISKTGSFKMLSIYKYSFDYNTPSESIIYDVSDVVVLPKIKAKITGGYVDMTSGYVKNFEEIDSSVDIVPNDSKKEKTQYILRVEVENLGQNQDVLKFEKYQSNQNVVIDYFDYEEDPEAPQTTNFVTYFRVTQNSQIQSETTLTLKMFYEIAKDISDEDVNLSLNYVFETKIAPTNILVNGLEEPKSLTLYNFYKYPDYGWNELAIDVISNFGTSPNFQGIYFVADDASNVDIMHNGISVNFVAQGQAPTAENLFTPEDLKQSFYIRGKYGTSSASSKNIYINVVSDIAQDLGKTISYSITEGATSVTASERYGKNGYYYLDYEKDYDFSQHVFADYAFQFFTHKLIGGSDVVDIVANTPYCKYDHQEDRFYLNMSINPKNQGIGIYRIYLDNGMPIELTFNVLKTLQTESTSFFIQSKDNDAVTEFSVSRSKKSDYDDQILLEILNDSSKNAITFGTNAYLNIEANSSKTPEFTSKNNASENYVGVAPSGERFKFTTYKNGKQNFEIKITGREIDDYLTATTKELTYKLTVVSYSLVNEFYLLNGDSFAVDNVVYYGARLDKYAAERAITFTPVVNNSNSFGFYKYVFNSQALPNMYDTDEISGRRTFDLQSLDFETYYETLLYENYSKDMIYFLATDEMGRPTAVSVRAVISKDGVEREVYLDNSKGLIFVPEDINGYVAKDENGVESTYSVKFDKTYFIGTRAEFDTESFTYRVIESYVELHSSDYLRAGIRQRKMPKRYEVKITPQKYKSVEGISLATSLEKLNFTNNNLKQVIGVYTYPTNSTSKQINIEFVKSDGNKYSNMVTYSIDDSSKENGVFNVTLSCEKFYQTYKDNIIDETCPLSGTIYIYPAEWGDSHSAIPSDLRPICIEVSYRNGSKQNPYLIESADDLAAINTNEITLKSHYEINSTIDMSSVKDFVPIGILTTTNEMGNVVYQVRGFSGTIVGTSSQALVTNIHINQNNFYKVAQYGGGEFGFGGLFAKINDLDGQYSIENVTFGGSVSAEFDRQSFVGLLAAVNSGKLSNVMTKVEKSSLTSTADLYFGGLVGVNNGEIYQDFTKYDESYYDLNSNVHYTLKNGAFYDANNIETRNFANLATKNLAYFNDTVSITAKDNVVVAGGIAGASSGIIKSFDSSNLTKYGYSSYAAYALIDILGSTDKNIYVGGAVGTLSYSSDFGYVPFGTTTLSIFVGGDVVDGFIVGGQISTENLTLSGAKNVDAVGGIVGQSDPLIDPNSSPFAKKIELDNMISRTFVRGYKFAGGIVGIDQDGYTNGNVKTPYGDSSRTEFGNCKIQAVDEGFDSLYCANIIKFEEISGLSSKDNAWLTKLAISGSYYSVPKMINKRGTTISTESYLNRTSLYSQDEIQSTFDNKPVLNTKNIPADQKIGDYVVFDKESSKVLSAFDFEKKSVEIKFDDTYTKFLMSSDAGALRVYFAYMFNVENLVNQNQNVGDSDLIFDTNSALNKLNPNSENYPFKMISKDIMIVASSSNKSNIDVDGNIALKDTGLAEIKLTSVLNKSQYEIIYIYIINYFNKDIQTSLFYTSASENGINVTNGSEVSIFGNSSSSINLVPNYHYESDQMTISDSGILRYQNVDYYLAKNSQLTTNVELDPEEDYFSAVQVNKQTVVFYKKSYAEGGDTDKFYLTPVLMVNVKVGDQTFVYYYKLENVKISISTVYQETATAIMPHSNYLAIQSNGYFSDEVEVRSQNTKENLFYEIFDKNGNKVQARMPESINEADLSTDAKRKAYYASTINDLFDFDITKGKRDTDGNIIGGQENVFAYKFMLNRSSTRFLQRKNDDIYGLYSVHFYANQLKDGVTASVNILLEEAELNYIDIANYSNFEDMSSQDKVIVPSQRGMLEITLDPIDALVDTITISNNLKNYQSGANLATFVFAYESVENGVVSYKLDTNFAGNENGSLSFKYQDMIDRLEELGVMWTGKIYISYYMVSNNVENEKQIAFDVTASYADNKTPITTTIALSTKLNSYARLLFDKKQNINGYYYLAKGLSYDLTLDYYGFAEDQITITSSNDDVVNIKKNADGKYVLSVGTNISYNNDIGYLVTVDTYASKVIDDVTITSRNTITIYVMEYVLNYVYDGTNKDIVKGMDNGVISVAIGNPYDLEFAIRDFLEYDKTNSSVNVEVETFVKDITEKMKWKVYYNGTSTTLQKGYSFATPFYKIDGFTFTALKLCKAESDIYHFSAEGSYKMHNGVYSYDEASINSNKIYTEFGFDIHDQSTEDSPLRIETYEDLMAMEDDEWYILLEDITLPSSFKPISTKIAGFDGNSHKLIFSGIYDFANTASIGIFESIDADVVVKNLIIYLARDTVFKTSATSFNVGLLTPENNGIVTNCLVDAAAGTSSTNKTTLSVESSQSAVGSYVSALVGDNGGFITNSRTKIAITSNANVSGFVGTNSGHIASSAFVGGTLTNVTNTPTEFTAGFVIENSGEIYTSYVSGTASANHVFYGEDDANEISDSIVSNNSLAGFAFTNSGTIKDSYSNILLKQSGAWASGFVFENAAGTIERCFSLSVLTSYQTSNYGFARSNSTGSGYIKDCFYLSDDNYNNATDETNKKYVNVSVGDINNNDNTSIKKLKKSDFKNLDKFKNFAVKTGINIDSVWFFNSDPNKKFNNQTLNTNRIELVAPNIIATSRRQFDHIEQVVDSETGATYTKYYYIYTPGYPALGTKFNPITIASAENFEDYITGENNASNFNYSYFRLISDIDYSDYYKNSVTYKTKFRGYFEGNFMKISGTSLISNESLISAGMFAEVAKNENNVDSIGAVMNFTFTPEVVNFSNAVSVGGIAGRLENGTIINVDINLNNINTNMVVGQNITGGIVGVALGDSKLQNVNSQFGAKARYQRIADIYAENFDEKELTYNKYSYAGSVVGVLSGNSTLSNSETTAQIAVLGGRAGLVIGFVDSNAKASDLYVLNNIRNVVNAYRFGGLVAGESKGTMQDIQVVSQSGENFKNFAKIPFVPQAVGGVVGRVTGGALKNISTNQSIETSSLNMTVGVSALGGVVGVISGQATLEDIAVTNTNLIGFGGVGGVVGEVTASAVLNNITTKTTLAVKGMKIAKTSLGGVVGRVKDAGKVTVGVSNWDELTNNYKNARAEAIGKKVIEGENESYTGLLGIYKAAGNDQAKNSPAAEVLNVLNEGRYLSDWIDLVSNDNDKSLVCQFVKENKGCQDLIAAEKALFKNKIETTVSTDISIYSGALNVNIGGVFGEMSSMYQNEAYGVSSILNTTGAICSVRNMSSTTGESESYVLSVEKATQMVSNTFTIGGLEITNGDSTYSLVKAATKITDNSNNGGHVVSNEVPASHCRFFCDMSFESQNSTDGENMFIVSNFGTAYIL